MSNSQPFSEHTKKERSKITLAQSKEKVKRPIGMRAGGPYGAGLSVVNYGPKRQT